MELRRNVRNAMTVISILYIFVLIPSTGLGVSTFLFDERLNDSDIIVGIIVCFSVCFSSVFSIAFVYITDVLLNRYPSKGRVASMLVKCMKTY